MVTIGPFESRWHYNLLTLTDHALYVFRLGLVDALKYAACDQIGIFCGNIDRIKTKTLVELKEKYLHTKIQISENFDIELRKSKFWKHHLIINTKANHFKLGILKRNEADKYLSILTKYYGERIKFEL